MNEFLLDSEKIDDFSKEGDDEKISEMLNIAEQQLKQGTEVIYGYKYFDILDNDVQKIETIMWFKNLHDFIKWKEGILPKFLP